GADPTVELSSAPTAELPREAGPQELRAAVLAALHPKLVRTINRGLQELHNHALNRVRRAPGRADLEALLPTEEQIGSLTELADDLLDQAYRAGTRSASSLAGRTLPEPAAPRDLDADFFGELVDRVHSGLAATLRTGLSAGEGRPSLSNRVGVVFGELKGPRAEELAASHLVHAYELGMLDAWSAGGVTSRRWVLGKEPRCPEGRCRHNDRTGALPIGQAFPSGHDVPPVHVGCTCTTLPSAES
ncbi:MAG: hypothetical protein M3N52_04105, partial [Actinomycetota bacterium]|nr:hypothetical protein [Actinomycetota bacterium]